MMPTVMCADGVWRQDYGIEEPDYGFDDFEGLDFDGDNGDNFDDDGEDF